MRTAEFIGIFNCKGPFYCWVYYNYLEKYFALAACLLLLSEVVWVRCQRCREQANSNADHPCETRALRWLLSQVLPWPDHKGSGRAAVLVPDRRWTLLPSGGGLTKAGSVREYSRLLLFCYIDFRESLPCFSQHSFDMIS